MTELSETFYIPPSMMYGPRLKAAKIQQKDAIEYYEMVSNLQAQILSKAKERARKLEKLVKYGCKKKNKNKIRGYRK